MSMGRGNTIEGCKKLSGKFIKALERRFRDKIIENQVSIYIYMDYA